MISHPKYRANYASNISPRFTKPALLVLGYVDAHPTQGLLDMYTIRHYKVKRGEIFEA